jgi:hypothetical protein
MPVAIRGTGGGSVTLSSGAAATDTTLTLPNTTGTVALTASPTFSGTLTATTITSPASTALTIQSAGTTAMTVDTSQNVGIGTTTPASGNKLQVNGKIAIGTNNVGLVLTDASSTQFQAFFSDTSSNLQISAGGSGTSMLFYNNAGNERMRIDSSGYVLIKTATSIASGTNARFQVSYLKQSEWGMIVRPSDNNTGGGGPVIFQNQGGTTIGTISADASNVAYNTSSDYRLKHSVAPIIGGLATVSALKPVTYKWIVDDKVGEGFLAHELQEIIPFAVTGEKDAVNEDGSIKPQGVDYSKIVVHLVAAIKELSAENDALEARLAALEAK